MRNIARGHTGTWGSLRACALAVALACLLGGGAVLAQPRIALDHAGLKRREVSKPKVRLGRYNKKKAYVVKFFRKHVKYEYCIRAKSGKVMFYSARRP